MGELGLTNDAALYTPEMANRPNYGGRYNGATGWRNHVISSTWRSDQPIVLWAEEGISISNYATRWSKPAPYSVRCVRNLGLESPAILSEGTAGDGYPTDFITVTKSGDTYRFDLSNINDMSIRYFTSRELEPGNEKMETSRVYYGFETGPVFTYPSSNQDGTNNSGNYQALESGTNISPTGYRVPNVREGALMSLYCDQSWWNSSGNIMVGSWYSNGPLGNNRDNCVSWIFNHNFATIEATNVRNIRSVKDWNPSQQ